MCMFDWRSGVKIAASTAGDACQPLRRISEQWLSGLFLGQPSPSALRILKEWYDWGGEEDQHCKYNRHDMT